MSDEVEQAPRGVLAAAGAGLARLGGRAAATVLAPLDYVAELVRWSEWRTTKLTLYLAGMAYAGIVQPAPDLALLGRMAALTAILCLFAAFGHLVNDFSDLEADRAAGKKRLLAEWSPAAAVAALVGIAAAMLGLAVLLFDAWTIALVGLSIALGAAYSLPPARLKERAVLGWVCATLAQRTLPMAIVFQGLETWTAGAVGLTALATVTGVRYIIVHQLIDLQNDLRAGISTAATERGPERLERLISARIFPLEIAIAVATVLAMAVDAPIVALAGIAYAAWVREGMRHGLALRGDSYAVFVTFYYTILPVLLSALLVNEAVVFLPLLALVVAIVQHDLMRNVRRVMPIYVKASAQGHFAAPPRQPAPARPAAAPRPAPPPPPAARPAEAAAPAVARRPPVPPAMDAERAAAANRAPRDARHAEYARARERTAVQAMTWPGLGPGWFVMRHATAVAMLDDPRLRDAAPRPAAAALPPDMAERIERRAAAVAEELIERHRPAGEIELVGDYAGPLCVRTASELLGLGTKDPEKLRALLLGLSAATDAGRRTEDVARREAELARYIEAGAEQRRREPRDDLLTVLVTGAAELGLPPAALRALVYDLLVEATVTGTCLLANAAVALLRNPDQLERLRAEPDLYPRAIEELLRYEPPRELSPARLAGADLELDGVRLPQGAAVRIVLPAVGRDPARFERPDLLDLGREPGPQLALGPAPETAPAAAVVRLLGRVGLRVLLERSGGLAFAEAGPVAWLANPVRRGPERLRLKL